MFKTPTPCVQKRKKKMTEQTGGPQLKVSDQVVHIPEEIHHRELKQTFSVGRFLGKGSYAKCFEVKNKENGDKFACKFLCKNILLEDKLSQCVRTEINIHSHIAHDNITQFVTDFCDGHNLYLILELCPFQSLKELQYTRRTITEIECRFFLRGILSGIRYLHQLKIVHRDLKLSNVFLSHNMSVKIGDFGLATRLTRSDDLLFSTCGTANYFSPEILSETGYAYEVDVWCVGVIMYFLLVGKAPFDGDNLDQLFDAIEVCKYHIPKGLSAEAALMIGALLQKDRNARPTAEECLQLDFIHGFIVPKSLPTYCLLREPRPEDIPFDDDEFVENFSNPGDRVRLEFKSMFGTCQERNLNDIDLLCQHLSTVTTNNKMMRHCQLNDIESDRNALQSKIWVKKWMYDRHSCSAFAYQLSDDSIGIFFEDKTKFSKGSGTNFIDYIDARGQTARITAALQKSIANFESKIELFREFHQDMRKRLKDSNHYKFMQRYRSQTVPTLHSWFTTAESMVMFLTNGIVQINFLDHFKLILDPRDATVTVMMPKLMPKTFTFANIESIALPSNILSRLQFAMVKIKYLRGHLKKSKGVRQKLI